MKIVFVKNLVLYDMFKFELQKVILLILYRYALVSLSPDFMHVHVTK